jgi:hypothetical protein
LLLGDDASPRSVLHPPTLRTTGAPRWRPTMVRQWSDSALLNPNNMRVLLS